MQTRKNWAFLLVLAGLILAACTPTPAPGLSPALTPVVSLDGSGWTMISLNGQSLLANTRVTLNFENGKLNGSDGCNSYGGAYTASGGKFSVDKNIMSTLMACAEPIMQQAAAYTEILPKATAYISDAQQLTLLDGSGKILAIFSKQSTELSGTSWVVTGFNNGKQAVISVLNGSQLTADFGAGGKLSGSAGCNSFTATYETSGKSIKIGPAASTKKMCSVPVGVMEQEMQYLKNLETAATYRLDGNQLELRAAGGELAVTLAKAGSISAEPTLVPQKAASIVPALPNAEYLIDIASTGKAQLKNGTFEELAAPGSASKIKIQLGNEQSFGDINGDGTEDAAVTLVANSGGTGTFTYLALVINEKGAAKPAPAVGLGDRILVKSIRIQPGSVTVTILTRKANEPMSAEPTVEVTRTFKWQDGKLSEVK